MRRENAGVVAWPKVAAVVDDRGRAEVTINGARQLLQAGDVAEARRAVIDHVATGTAAVLERPVRMEVTDPDGSWLLLVHPDGEIEALEDAPAPTRRRRALPMRIGRLRPNVQRFALAGGIAAMLAIGAVTVAALRGQPASDARPQSPAAASAPSEPIRPPTLVVQPERASTPSPTVRDTHERTRRPQRRKRVLERQRSRRAAAKPRPKRAQSRRPRQTPAPPRPQSRRPVQTPPPPPPPPPPPQPQPAVAVHPSGSSSSARQPSSDEFGP